VIVTRCPRLRFTRTRGADAPNHVANVIGHQQCAPTVDDDPDGTSAGVAVAFIEEPGQHVHRITRRHAVGERNEDQFVSAPRLPVPRTVLPHEHAAAESAGDAAGRVRKSQRGGVRAERIVGNEIAAKLVAFVHAVHKAPRSGSHAMPTGFLSPVANTRDAPVIRSMARIAARSFSCSIPFSDVAIRSHRHVQRASVRTGDDVLRPVMIQRTAGQVSESPFGRM